ncbi:MAG: nicotinamidase [Ignisphaera sp.]
MALISITPKDALIIVDMQNDFMPGGTLPVANALTIIPIINKYIELFTNAKALIVASRDWHPPNHISFNTRGGPWPPHCVQGTEGAKFHPELKLTPDTIIVSKGYEENKEAYSSFEGTELNEILRSKNVRRLFVCGVATDYCVKATVLDAIKLGYTVLVLNDAIKGVDLPKGSVDKAVSEMLNEGAIFITLHDILSRV